MIFKILSSVSEVTSSVADNATSSDAANTFSLNNIIETIVQWCLTSGIKLLVGLVVLFIVFKIIDAIAKSVKKAMHKKHRDETISRVVYKVVKYVLKALVFLLFLGFVGIDTAGIGSIIASAAVAIGLALQGSLANIAGWVIIIVMRPFKLDDYIECQDVSGTVEDIKLFHTYLRTPNNIVVMVPNGALTNGNIINYSMKDTRRLDQDYVISYENDAEKAIKIINDVIATHADILNDPAPFVKLTSLDAHGIKITCRVWTKQSVYWDVHFQLLKEIKEAFDKNGIVIPYNQLDVHIDNKNSD